jgi:hypothetical protein
MVSGDRGRGRRSGATGRGRLQELADVDIVGPNTLKIPYDDWATGKGVVGSGPFVLQSYTQGQPVILTPASARSASRSSRTIR